MNEKDKIRKGLPPKRDPTCYQVEQDIVIPAGTMLRSQGDGKFGADVGLMGQFVIKARPADETPGFKRVVAP